MKIFRDQPRHTLPQRGPTHLKRGGKDPLVSSLSVSVRGERSMRGVRQWPWRAPKSPGKGSVGRCRQLHQPFLASQHGLQAGFIRVIPAQQVQEPVAGKEQQLSLQFMAGLPGLAHGAVAAD